MADDLTIQQLRSLMESPGIGRTPELRPAPPAVPAPAGAPSQTPSFADTLKESIQQISQLQMEANKAMQDMATGENVDVQGTILALQKADVSFKLMMEVRNKIVSAYQEVMRTQV